MSGSTIGGVVGAFVGYFVGSPQLGWMIGSAIGGYVDPEQISQFGPRLTDASQQTAQDGVPIPYGYGTFPCHGNLIWCSDITEHANESTDDGKGSGVETTTTTYSYSRSYAIGICQGEIAGLLQIKRNGKIVWDTRTDAEIAVHFDMSPGEGMLRVMTQNLRATSAKFSTISTIYTGSETQTADPTIEAHEGVGNVPGFRGLAYIVVTDDDVTELRGAVPQYEFVVATTGTTTEQDNSPSWMAIVADDAITSPDGEDWSAAIDETGVAGNSLLYSHGVLLKYSGTDFYRSLDYGETWEDITSAPDAKANGAAYHAGRFWLVGNDPDKLYSSPNGKHWDEHTVDMFSSISAIGCSDSVLVVGDSTGYCRVSTDGGGTWDPLIAVMASGVTAIEANGSFIVCGAGAGELAYSSNSGASWTTATSPFVAVDPNGVITCIRYGDGLWVASTGDSANPLRGQMGYSANGTDWTLATDTIDYRGAWIDYANGLFVVVGQGGLIATSTDGDIWTEHANAFQFLGTSDISSVAAFPCDGIPVPGVPEFTVDHQGNLCGPDTSTLDPGAVLLSDIVAAEFQRVGLSASDYDVSQLTDEVLGYRVLPNGSGVDAALGPLMQAYFFDIAEWDGKLRCIKRGGASSLSLTMDDLAERDGEAIEWTRVQEAELLRVVTVGYIDPAAGYAATTQKWERRAGTVQAKGEAAVQVPITADADTGAGIAKKRGLIAWAETEKAKLSLPYRRAGVTPTDVLTLTDDAGESHRLRVGQIEDDSGVRLLEVTKERGNVYAATATGVNPNTPSAPNGNLPGPTLIHAMNLPRLRSADNKPGAYIAVTGVLPGWQGADIYISVDGGVSEQFAARIQSRATMGQLAAGCTASSEPIIVTLYDGRTLSTITADQMVARLNGFAITSAATSEVGQFQTTTQNADDDWELTNVLRGQLGTTATTHLGGDDFTLLDAAVQFVPLDVSLAGKTLILRAVSIGTANDDNETIEFLFDPQFTGPESVEFYTNASGEKYTDADGAFYFRE